MPCRNLFFFQFFVIALSIVTIYPQQPKMSDDLTNFKAFYEQELDRAGIVGSSFVFLHDGKAVADLRYGLANIEKKQPVTAETIFHWASNTKPFTGIAIMQLRDRGLLKLDDPVTKYVPELRKIHNSFGSMDEITIRHLMTHSGGFRGGTWPWRTGKPWEPFEPTEWSQLVAMFPFTEVQFKPGTKFSYSNPGIIYLGRAIETLSGESYETYIDKNIFRPLGMTESYFDTTPPHLLALRSHSYYIDNGKRTEGRFDADTGITVSNSGLNAPMTDMVKYLNFLVGVNLEGLNRSAEYDAILKRASLEEMWQPQFKTETDANGNRGFTTDVGLIFFIDQTLGKTHLGHGGDQNGFISYIDFNPEKRKASILVLNTALVADNAAQLGENPVARLRKAVRGLF